MDKLLKNILTSSTVAVALMGVSLPVSAEEQTMPNQQMMQQQSSGSGSGSGTAMPCGPGYGMGPGMMGGYGPGYGMGPGMMGGWAGGAANPLKLSDAQTAKLEKIQNDLIQKHRTLMGQMWDEQAKLAKLYNAEKHDPEAIGKAYSKLSDLQRQAIEASIEAENKLTAVLTKEQREQMHRGFGWGMMGY